MKSRIKEWALNTILVIVSGLVTFVLFEAAYRYRLYHIRPTYFIQEANQPRSVPFHSHSIWEFDEDLGFRYRRDSPVLVGGISNGKLAGCGVLDPKDLGGIGKKERWTENAELKVLVLGDSFTAISANGRSWPDYLQDELQRRLGKRVDVINLGMDGIGIMQMLRVAAHSVPALKPDLVIVAFTTDDITRGMFWRTTARIAGRTRALTTTRPERVPDLRYAVDTVVIGDKVTLDWCNKMPKPDRANDRVVQDIELRYRLGVGLSESRADLYGFDRSLVIERIIYGPTLRPPPKKSVNPRHDLTSFSQDARTRSDAELIKRHAPVLLFHVTQRTEVRMKTSYVFNEEQRQALLLQSLKDLFDTAIAETSDHLPPDLDIEAMGMSKEDDHPSPYGMRIYAHAAAEALLGRCQPAVKACGRFN